MNDGNAKCPRCGWPIVSKEESGCTVGRCNCLCANYPACLCGGWDKNNPEVAISVPKEAAAQAAAVAPKPITIMPFPPPPGGGPMPFPTQASPFVLLNQPKGEKAEVIYIGNDKVAAFDKLMELAKNKDFMGSELQFVEEGK